MGLQGDFIKDTVVYGLGNGLKKFIGIFLLPFYTRALTVGEFGILETLSTYTMFAAALVSMGLDSGCAFFFFKASPKEKGDITYTLFIIRLVTFLPALIPLFYTRELSLLFFKSENYSFAIVLACIVVPMNLLMGEQTRLFRYYREPWRFSVGTVVKALANVLVGISLVVVLDMGVDGSMIARLGSSTLVVFVSLVFFNWSKYSYRFSFFWLKKMLKFGFPLIGAGIAVWILNSSDRFFLLHFRTLSELGMYSIGTTFSQPILLLNMAVQMSFGVLFFSLYNREDDPDKKESKTMAKGVLNLYLSFSSLVAVGLSVFGEELVLMVTTPDYLKGASVIPFLVFANIAAQSYQTMGPGILIAEKTWHFAWITCLAAAINIGLNFMIIPKFGFLGAGATTLVAFVVYWGVKVGVAHRLFPVDYAYLKVFLFFILNFLLAVFPMGITWTFESEVGFWGKSLILLVGCTLPFLFGFITFSTIKDFLINLKERYE